MLRSVSQLLYLLLGFAALYVFVVVAFSVIVQGGSVPFAARRLGVPMRLVHRGDS